jgi:hypothetical protein
MPKGKAQLQLCDDGSSIALSRLWNDRKSAYTAFRRPVTPSQRIMRYVNGGSLEECGREQTPRTPSRVAA